MFDPDSRYASLEVASLPADEGDSERGIRYVRRRFLPTLPQSPELAQHAVQAGDRLDNLSARYVGDAKQFWRICDMNPVLFPEELTETPGQVIRIFVTVR